MDRTQFELNLLNKEGERIMKEITHLGYQTQMELTDEERKVCDFQLLIASLELEINDYQIEYENATTERKTTLDQLIVTTKGTLILQLDSLKRLQAPPPNLAEIERQNLERQLLNQLTTLNLNSNYCPPPSPHTDDDTGKYVIANLKDRGMMEIILNGEGPSALSEDIVARGKELMQTDGNKAHERLLVDLYTPYIEEIVREINPSDISLVNSEEYPWLHASREHTKCALKPDLFLCYTPLVEFKSAYKDALNPDARSFGIFPCWNARSSLWCIMDAKWQIDSKAFGEKIKYLQYAGYNCHIWPGAEQPLKLLLFDVNEFWMVVGFVTAITKLTVCKWVLPGSRQILKAFLTTSDPWMKATKDLLERLNVQLSSTQPILGAGTYGRAFALADGRVLKVSVGPQASELQREFGTILSLQLNSRTAEFVIPVEADSFVQVRSENISNNFAAYIMTIQGEKIDLKKSKNIGIKLVKFLYRFHVLGFVHGDSRVDNILIVNGQFKFIDLSMSKSATPDSKVNDFVLLFTSLIGIGQDFIRPLIDAILNPPTSNQLQLNIEEQSASKLGLLIHLLNLFMGTPSQDANENENENDGIEEKN